MKLKSMNLIAAALFVPWMNACADGHTGSEADGMEKRSEARKAYLQPSSGSETEAKNSGAGRTGANKSAPRSASPMVAGANAKTAAQQRVSAEETKQDRTRKRGLQSEREQARAGKEYLAKDDEAISRMQEQLEAAKQEIEVLRTRNQELVEKANESDNLHNEVADLRREVVWLRSLVDKSRMDLDHAESGLAGIREGIKDIQKAINGARLELSKEPESVAAPNAKHHSGNTTGPDRNVELRGREVAVANSANRRHR